MNTAKQIMGNNSDYTTQMIAADEAAVDKNQDWEEETTIFEFEDGSSILCDGLLGECRIMVGK